ncbi:MAG: glycosyltransferase family 4 protein [Actinomycetota bacterium]|nr:glycosyltransferase family 4 protein [Actinomycetota bacterium]
MGTSGRPALLFLSPIMPALGGNGLAMRAGATLEALAADYTVHLLVIDISGPSEPPGEAVRRWSARILTYPAERHVDPLFQLIEGVRDPDEQLTALLGYPRPALCRYATSAAVREAAEVAAGPDYRAVHVLRLYLAPFAEPYLAWPAAGRPGCALDLDDEETTTRTRIARLLREDGHERAARAQESEADRYEALAAAVLPRFDRVYVASAADRDRVALRHPGPEVAVLENVVRWPGPVAPPPAGTPFTFVFVANFGYYPNDDAARYFCAEVLPLLRTGARRPFRAHLVGANPSAIVRRLADQPEVTVIGRVADVTPWYESAHAAVVPLRAGGGTRIKVLEAFAHRRPVVSTSIGAEGLGATTGCHLLIADSPADFAAACVRLMEEPSAGQALADRGAAFVRRRVPTGLRAPLTHRHGP